MPRLLASVSLVFALSACSGSDAELERPAPPPQPPVLATQTATLPVQGVLNVITTKNGTAEVPGQLTGVSGDVTLADVDGWAGLDGNITVDLATWDSGLELRDDRIKETFFELALHPRVTFKLGEASGVPAEGIPVGATAVPLTVDGQLQLHGATQDVSLKLLVSRPVKEGFKLESQEALVVTASSFGMADQLEALRVLCAHESLSDEVRISLDVSLGQLPEVAPEPTPAEGEGEADPGKPPPVEPG